MAQNLKILFILKLVPKASFAISTAHDKVDGQEQRTHLILLLVANIFTSSL